jgi:hypothetical protein
VNKNGKSLYGGENNAYFRRSQVGNLKNLLIAEDDREIGLYY